MEQKNLEKKSALKKSSLHIKWSSAGNKQMDSDSEIWYQPFF